MIYITQLIHLKSGLEEIFNQFEAIVIPLIPKYNGELMIRMKVDNSAIIDSNIKNPNEIHIVKFESDKDLSNFLQDKDRLKFLNMKTESIESEIIIIGEKLNP